ncbi:MAG: translational GTPase TypA [Planctomycetes bacterium]|nr:translational GTPase TypA [Planctomycetota bacterium]
MSKHKPAIKNIAIIAHVDHGKTTLVDAMFKFAGTFRANQKVEVCAMDSDAQERERGITILAKNTALNYLGTRINVVDTPGHADFGGQVERTLNMADAALLLVDAHEGPMPQTRFVLKKAFERGLKVLVLINKIDRPDQRAHQVLNEVFDLFIELGAHDDQLDFQVCYGSGRSGFAVKEFEDAFKDGPKDMKPLFDMILEHVPAPPQDDDAPLQFQCATIEHDDFLGRIGIGRVYRGTLRAGMRVAVCHPDREASTLTSVKQVLRFEGLTRQAASEVLAGDIAIVGGGVDELTIGDTLCAPDVQEPLPAIKLEEPTIAMTFGVNTSPFAGKEGKFVTSRQIGSRLELAAMRDVALVIAPTEFADTFEVKGRGVMHLGVLAENMRREGFEFAVGKPRVILKEVDGTVCEPMERTVIEVPTEHAGKIIEFLGRRRGEMLHMEPFGQTSVRLEFIVPSRGLIGARTAMMTLSKGEAILSHVFDSWRPDQGPVVGRTNGVLVADRAGDSVPYGMFNLLDRGEFFIAPGTPVYEGMIVGENNKDKDLDLNVCREKKLTNIRSAGADENVILPPPRQMSLEESLEYIDDDELVEITPKNLRLRKRILTQIERTKAARKTAKSLT